ncbi:hypothetical protein PanWU01x14_088500 [Parasponia andersonii]|uniref:Uncharacterized protein n=1 Tax=Parasponia andersonii TaxID=3476 RepID=A0A2P5D7X8_PARAD|nr:hypothetical protein PanWU01x14_088500 [Parasponia andersonii]
MVVVNEAKTVYCSLIDDDDEGIENPHPNETVASINASEEPISIPIGIPKGLPSYFDWPNVIRCTLHRLNGPSQSRLFKPLTWLEQNLAAHIERYVTPIEIDDKPQRQWKRDGGGAGACTSTTTTKREKKKKQEKEKKEKKARTKLTASQRMDRRLQAIWDNIFEKKPQEKGGAYQGMSLKRKKADREGPKEKKVRKKQCMVSAAKTLRETNDDQPANESAAAPNSNATRRMNNSSQISNRLRYRNNNNNNDSRSVNLPSDEELMEKKAEEKQYSVTDRLNEARRRIMSDLGQNVWENNDKQCSFATAMRLLNQQHNKHAEEQNNKGGIVIKQCCTSDEVRVANQPDNNLVEKKQQYSSSATDQRTRRPDEVTEKRTGKKQQYSSLKGTMNLPNKLSGAAQTAGENKQITMNTPPNKLSRTAQTAGENKQITMNTPPNKLSGTAQTAGEKKRITMNTTPNKVAEKQNNEANKLLEQKAREKQHSSPATGSLIKNHKLPKKSNWPDQDIIRKAMVLGLTLRSQYAKEQQQQQKQLGKTVLPLSTSSKQIMPNRNAVLIKGHNHHHQREQISSRTNFVYNTPSAYHSASYNNPGGTNLRLLEKSSSLNSAPTTNAVDVRRPPIGPVMIKREKPASESLGFITTKKTNRGTDLC